MTFEARTPDLEQKIATVRAAFANSFGEFEVVVHELVKGVEIAGGCSNKNFALREAFRIVSTRHADFADTCYTVTTCDTDSLFHPTYFDVLEACYNAENPQPNHVRAMVWQPAMFYNWDLDERAFFVRVTGIMRAMMMLGVCRAAERCFSLPPSLLAVLRVVLCIAVLCCAVLCCAVLCCAVLCCAVLC
jgi:hypothetical protein